MTLRLFLIVFMFIFVACSHLVTPPVSEEVAPPVLVTHEISQDGKTVSIHIPHGAMTTQRTIDSLLALAAKRVPYEEYFVAVEDDSLRSLLVQQLHDSVVTKPAPYSILNLSSDGFSTTIELMVDELRLTLITTAIINKYAKPEREGASPTYEDFSFIPSNLLLLPCSGVEVPDRVNLLPNAPRTYRSGIHRGIDFPATFGTEVRCVSNGVVIRADHGYREVTNEFRESLLEKAANIKKTPSDIFDFVLLGRSVFVDHGLEIIPGKRLVSIYAHLSHIDEIIQVGKAVERGQLLGLVGNSGTSDGAKGKRNGAHLHFELLVQDESGERYLGEGLPYTQLVDLLDTVFVQE